MDHYTILGISHSASFAEIKAHYRLLSKKHHPDVGGDPRHMAHINQAYTVLSNPFKRSTYDAEWRRHVKLTTPPSRQSSPWPAPRSAQESGQTAPTDTFVRRRRHGLWWAIAAGLACACLVVIGAVAMNSVSSANPSVSTEPADKPRPSFAGQSTPPMSVQTNDAITPMSPAVATIPPSHTAGTSLHTASSSAEDLCRQNNVERFKFKQCKNNDQSVTCTKNPENKSRVYHKVCYERNQ